MHSYARRRDVNLPTFIRAIKNHPALDITEKSYNMITYGGYIITREWRKLDQIENYLYIAKLINKPKVCFFDTFIGSTLEEVKGIIEAENAAKRKHKN